MREPVDEQLLQDAVRHLASFERGSTSEGERRAAEWIAAALRDEGCDTQVETAPAHGGYWLPLGSLALLAGLAGLTRRRGPMAAAGAAAALGIRDDITAGRLWWRRHALPMGTAHNVVAVAGDRDAERTLVLVAHHDAAHWSLLFSPAVPEWVDRHVPGALEKSDTTLPLMWPVIAGPVMTAVAGLTGSRVLRRLGTAFSLGTALTMAEIGSRGVVPGANDNLSGVATLLGVARALRERPVPGLRVLLVSTGSEESFMEGMHGFAARHFPSLPVGSTSVLCIDTVGSEELILLEGEGMLKMRDYPAAFKQLVSDAAQDAEVHVRRGLRFRNATDGLLALKAGYPSGMLGSVNRLKLPDNYHWPTDVPDNVHFGSVADAVRLCTAVARRVARG